MTDKLLPTIFDVVSKLEENVSAIERDLEIIKSNARKRTDNISDLENMVNDLRRDLAHIKGLLSGKVVVNANTNIDTLDNTSGKLHVGNTTEPKSKQDERN